VNAHQSQDGDGGVEVGAAFNIYSSETVSPGSHFGRDESRPALTFTYHATTELS